MHCNCYGWGTCMLTPGMWSLCHCICSGVPDDTAVV